MPVALALAGLAAMTPFVASRSSGPSRVTTGPRPVVAPVLVSDAVTARAPQPPTGVPSAFTVVRRTATVDDPDRSLPARGARPELAVRTFQVVVRFPDARRAGPFPVVVFAHGYSADVESYAPLLDGLAARGFIVAAPEFPLTSTAYTGPVDRSDLVRQAGDVTAVLDALLDPDRGLGVPPGIVDHDRIVVMGHSDGAVTAAGVAYSRPVRDDRIDAAVLLSGALVVFPEPWFGPGSAPMLVVHGGADEVNDLSGSSALYSRMGAAAAKAFVVVRGAGHLDAFVGPGRSERLIERVVGFLDGVVGGRDAGWDQDAWDRFVAGVADDEFDLVAVAVPVG
jgi:alpha-beta hydrolase superfamily lysophospholipase